MIYKYYKTKMNKKKWYSLMYEYIILYSNSILKNVNYLFICTWKKMYFHLQFSVTQSYINYVHKKNYNIGMLLIETTKLLWFVWIEFKANFHSYNQQISRKEKKIRIDYRVFQYYYFQNTLICVRMSTSLS